MFNKLKQFKDLRDQAKKIQQKLATEEISVDGNWGKLQLTLNGNMEVLKLEIDETLLEKSNKASLQNELAELFNSGVKKMQKTLATKMAKEGGLPNLSDMLK